MQLSSTLNTDYMFSQIYTHPLCFGCVARFSNALLSLKANTIKLHALPFKNHLAFPSDYLLHSQTAQTHTRIATAEINTNITVPKKSAIADTIPTHCRIVCGSHTTHC